MIKRRRKKSRRWMWKRMGRWRGSRGRRRELRTRRRWKKKNSEEENEEEEEI